MRTLFKLSVVLGLIACVIFGLFVGLYFYPATAPNTVNIWLANARCSGFNDDNLTVLFEHAQIKKDVLGTITFVGNGLEADAYVGNVTNLSLCDTLFVWANDQRNLYSFDVISEGDESFADELYTKVLDVNVTARQDGLHHQLVPYSKLDKLVTRNSSVYVNLDQIEDLLNIKGNTSYTLSLSMRVQFSAYFPAPSYLTNNPSSITDEKTVDFGNITINCINGQRTNAHINQPYQKFSYEIQIPYIQTIIPC